MPPSVSATTVLDPRVAVGFATATPGHASGSGMVVNADAAGSPLGTAPLGTAPLGG